MSIKFDTNKKNGDSTIQLLDLENTSVRNSMEPDCIIRVSEEHVSAEPRIYKIDNLGSSTSSEWISSEENDSHKDSSARSSTYAKQEPQYGSKNLPSSSSSTEYLALEDLLVQNVAEVRKSKRKPFLQTILPKFLLSPRDGEQQRPKSFDGFASERPILPKKWRKTMSRPSLECNSGERGVERRSLITNKISRLNTRLLDAIEFHNNVEVESMLHAGANPNASCRAGHISACHVAAYANSDALHHLLKFNADKRRVDKFGRSPLHLAAWAGKNWSIAMLLEFPIDLQYKVALRVTPEAEEEIKVLSSQWSSLIDVPCELPLLSVIPQTWKDSIEHKCRRFMSHVPEFFPGWTALHIASFAGHHNATRLLLAAGANPNCKDAMGQTPLDIVGAACYREDTRVDVHEYEKTVDSLIEFGGYLNRSETVACNVNSALHTAVELHSLQGIHMLFAAGAPACQLNARGNTPLHECVVKFYKEPLQVLANYSLRGFQSLDVLNREGYTVLHAAIMAAWIPGVCIALDAGADVMFETRDGMTAIHLAALKGDLDIIDEILLNAAQHEDAVNYNNFRTEPPIFCAIRSGIIDCVQTFLDAGAEPKMSYYVEPSLGDTTMEAYLLSSDPEMLKNLNMILHATAEAGNVDMLEILFEHDINLRRLLFYKCAYLQFMTPVEFAAYHDRFFTYKYLLRKTLARAREIHSPYNHSRLLNIIVQYNREEMFREMVRQIPDAVPMALGMGYFPLHVAAKNSNRNLLEQLIYHGADLSEENDEGTTAISLVVDNISKPTEFLENLFDYYVIMTPSNTRHTFTEITIDYRALIPDTVEERMSKGQLRILSALLKTGNRQNQRKLLAHPLIESFLYLKWKTLSTYFYLMVFLYFLFVMSVSVFTVSAFYFKDTYNGTASETPDVSWTWNPTVWKYAVYITLGLVVIQELSCTNLDPTRWINKFFYIEFWVKALTCILAIALPQVVSMEIENKQHEMDWPRHTATVTLVVAWLNIMILLSKTPMAGYYMQMFWNISFKIIQILITFLFLILMFSFCFMLQFHAQVPFEGPWAAIVKTLVMMTSEFDYSATFTLEKAKSLSTPIQLLRVVFVVFLILTAIVLMNLTIGVAVHDIQNLVQDGNLKRLDKQVGFLNRLEGSRGKTSFFHMLGLHRWYNYKKVPQTVSIMSVNVECCYGSRLKEALINKAHEQRNKIEKEAESNMLETKLEQITRNIRDVEVNILYHIFDLKAKLDEQCTRALGNCKQVVDSSGAV